MGAAALSGRAGMGKKKKNASTQENDFEAARATAKEFFDGILSQGSNHGNGIEVTKLSSAYAAEYGPNFEAQVGIKLKLFLKAHYDVHKATDRFGAVCDRVKPFYGESKYGPPQPGLGGGAGASGSKDDNSDSSDEERSAKRPKTGVANLEEAEDRSPGRSWRSCGRRGPER